MSKIKKYSEYLNEEVGMRNITQVFKEYKEAEIWFHKDLDGVASAISLKEYLKMNGIKTIDAHYIQYGDDEFAIKNKKPGVLACLVDFAHTRNMFKIFTDHHDTQTGVNKGNATYAKKARSNAETLSSEIPNTDIFLPADIELIKTVDSADFLSKGITPDMVSNSIFKKNTGKSGHENRFLMGFVINRLLLAYKNKKITVKSLDGKRDYVNKNFLECLTLDSNASLYSLYNNIKHYVNNAAAENWSMTVRAYEIGKLASPEELEKNHQDYIEQMKTKVKSSSQVAEEERNGSKEDNNFVIDEKYGISIMYGAGSMMKPGAYDRYTVFKNNPNINFNVIIWPMGLIQASCNPFRKKELEDINLGSIAKEVMSKYESKFKKIFISVLDIKKFNEGGLEKEEKIDLRHKQKNDRPGFKYEDLVSFYKDVMKYQPGLISGSGDKSVEKFDPLANTPFVETIKAGMDKLYKNLTDAEKNALRNVKVSTWDIIMGGSGGHASITNLQPFSILAYRKEGIKLYFGTEEMTQVMKMIQRDFVELLRQKIDLAKKGEILEPEDVAWGNTSLTERVGVKKFNEHQNEGDEINNQDLILSSDETTSIKPEAEVVGKDGNVFNILGICTTALRRAGQKDKVKELTDKVFAAKSYDDALAIMGEYCELV